MADPRQPKGGRPFFDPSAAQRTLVQNCVAFGLTAEQTALLVINPRNGKPINRATLFRYFKKDMAEGQPRANVQVAGALYSAAMAGNVAAQMFWLKTRAGWREVQYVQVVPVPSEMSDEQLDEAIEVAQADAMARAAGGNVASLAAYRTGRKTPR